MTLSAGTKLGPYEIISPLGAGGMGEVYKANDTRLGREVAVKVLPSHLAANPELKQRFEREARAVSALSHPHICALYDVGSQEGVDYLVMEYVEGETLADRLLKGPLPTEQVLRFGAEIADALDRAHRQGIIHRDLKPGNVMLTKSGVKLLDFGLAKIVAAAPAQKSLDESTLPTEAGHARALTEQGTILGTFQYMSPEQLEGSEADARSDIFALGAVLYEMASGQKAFSGGSRASLIAAILDRDPAPISSIAPMTPPALDRVVKTCLAKDPENRFQTAHDVRLELQWIAEGGSQAGAPAVVVAKRRGRERLAWIVAGSALAAAAALAAILIRRPASPRRVLRSAIVLPADLTVDRDNDSLALSPDGRTLAVVASGAGGRPSIYLRALDSLATQPLPGTEGGISPFWSPDGRSLAFFADGKVKRIEIAGGAVQTICEAPQGRGGAWGPEGVIVFAPNVYGPLLRVSSAGGTALPAEPSVGPGVSHRDPYFLPDGKRVLFFSFDSARPKQSGVYALDLASGKSRLVLHGESEGRYVSPGYLAFVRDKNVMIQPFDAGNLRLSGEAVPVAEKVGFDPFRGTAEYSFSSADLLIYQTEAPTRLSQLTWFSADGARLSTVGPPVRVDQIAISPDGKRAAVIEEGAAEGPQLWIVDLVRGVSSRVSFGIAAATDPAWSPDGRRVVYSAFANGSYSVQVKDANGGSPAQTLLLGPEYAGPTSWSPDGNAVAFYTQSGQTKSFDVGIVPIAGDHKPRLILAGPANESAASFSPDGRWLAYISDESGKGEVYVVPFPGPGGKWQITTEGALGFSWAGKDEIVSISPARKVWAIRVVPSGGGLEIGAPRPVFGGNPLPAGGLADYSSMLKRWLIAMPSGEATSAPITLVTNWAAALEKR